MSTLIASRLELTYPIIQAPMAGGGDTPRLVAAVSSSGGLGFLGCAYLTHTEILEVSKAVRKLTARPFGINLFAPSLIPREIDASKALKAVTPYFREIGLPDPGPPKPFPYTFDEQFAAVLEVAPSCFSFTFGRLPSGAVEELRKRRIIVLGTATTVEEGIALAQDGVDAVIAQGSEAGGHRGSFDDNAGSGLVGTMALVPQLVDALKIPVVASGGIMDGRGVAAAFCLGASAVQMGTAFLCCDESGVSAPYRRALSSATEDETRITRAFSGRPARGIVNRFMEEVDAHAAGDSPILPFPFQNNLTRPLRSEAAKQGRSEFLSLWAGQGLRMIKPQGAADLVRSVGTAAKAILRDQAQQF
ncbi:MAG: nitronate monooxygenase [Burkholderiaceae bacterium]|jgi:nitronate monooxygenase